LKSTPKPTALNGQRKSAGQTTSLLVVLLEQETAYALLYGRFTNEGEKASSRIAAALHNVLNGRAMEFGNVRD
jgi:hypothetical protein